MRNRTVLGWMACGGTGCLTCCLVLGILLLRFMAHSPSAEFARHNAEGNRFYAARQYERAAAEYTEMTKVMPGSMEGYYLRAMAEMKMKQYQKSIDDNTHILKMSSNTATLAAAHYNRGDGYYYLKKYKPAILEYDTAGATIDKSVDTLQSAHSNHSGTQL